MLESDKYSGIAEASQGLYRDKGSRFIGYAFPVTSEEEVKSLVDNIRREHHGARHHCWAYRIASIDDTLEGPGLSKEGLWRCNDDGEPSGTAGRQILGRIDAAGLQDVLVVVVRYFGGILLGVPGLIAAYRAATDKFQEKWVTSTEEITSEDDGKGILTLCRELREKYRQQFDAWANDGAGN